MNDIETYEAQGMHAGEAREPKLQGNGEWVAGDRWSDWLLTRRQVTKREGL